MASDPAEAALEWLGARVPESAAALRLGGESPAPPAGRCVAAMDPVSIAADMRELHLVEPAPALDEGEATALLDSIRPALAERDMTGYAAAPGRWYAMAGRELRFTAPAPCVAQGRGLRESMPQGRDGAALRSLMNEIQMIWHDHAVNRVRARRRLAPVNSVWFWGADRPASAMDAPAPVPPTLYADDPLLRGLWLRLGGEVRAAADEGLAAGLRRGAVAELSTGRLPGLGVRSLARRRRLRLVLCDGVTLDLSPWRRLWPDRRPADMP